MKWRTNAGGNEARDANQHQVMWGHDPDKQITYKLFETLVLRKFCVWPVSACKQGLAKADKFGSNQLGRKLRAS